MTVLKIIEVLVGLTCLGVIVGITWKFIKETIDHRRRMNKLDQWSKFHQQLMDWSKEISDMSVRVDFMNFCANELIQQSNQKLKNDMLDNWDINEEKLKIFNHWGQHIPSLLQEVRESKLNKIL
jgi:hypothetical protein